MHHDDTEYTEESETTNEESYEGPPEEVEKYYWEDKRWREEQGK